MRHNCTLEGFALIQYFRNEAVRVLHTAAILHVEANCHSSAAGAAFLSPVKMLEAWLKALLNFS